MNLVPLSAQSHGRTRVLRPQTYDFARNRAIVPLGASEIAEAALAVPIVFAARDGVVVPHALMGFQSERNLLVAPDGRWMGRYVPAVLRSHPFAMAQTEKGEYFLCVEQNSEFVGDAPAGERLFDDGGEPTPALQSVIAMFDKLKNDLHLARVATEVLQDRGLIEAWPITVRHDAGEAQLEGLSRVTEAGLTALPDDAFLRLRSSGALALAYAQLLSMPNLGLLAETGRMGLRAAEMARTHSQAEIDLSWMNKPTQG